MSRAQANDERGGGGVAKRSGKQRRSDDGVRDPMLGSAALRA